MAGGTGRERCDWRRVERSSSARGAPRAALAEGEHPGSFSSRERQVVTEENVTVSNGHGLVTKLISFLPHPTQLTPRCTYVEGPRPKSGEGSAPSVWPAEPPSRSRQGSSDTPCWRSERTGQGSRRVSLSEDWDPSPTPK